MLIRVYPPPKRRRKTLNWPYIIIEMSAFSALCVFAYFLFFIIPPTIHPPGYDRLGPCVDHGISIKEPAPKADLLDAPP